MKMLKKVLCALALAVMGLWLVATPALADDGPYQYTVRVFAGNQGTLTGLTQQTYTYNPANPTEINVVDVFGKPEVNDPTKYYFKYYRIAGQDDNLSNLKAVVVVDHDIDLIASYGAVGDMETVTIQFVVQGTGQVLGTRDVQGKVNDRIVEGYEYFEGYRPLYRNITGIVPAGGATWTLEYVPVEAGEGTETVTTQTVYVDGGTTVIPGGGGTTTGGTATGGAAGTTEGGAAGTTEGGAAATTPTTPAAPPTQEILDVDNPLASPDANGTGTGTGEQGTGTENIEGEGNPAAPGQSAFSPALTAGIAAGAALVAGLIIYLMRKNKDQQ